MLQMVSREWLVRLCATIGLEPEKLLAWYAPILGDIEEEALPTPGTIAPERRIRWNPR